MKSRTRPSRTSTTRGAGLLAVVALAAVGAVLVNSSLTGPAVASEKNGDAKEHATANAMALPDTYRVALTLQDRGETFEFSTVTAMRHFSLAPPERHIRFRGRLWVQADGRELLDFSVDLGQLIAQKDGGNAVSSEGRWAGSTYVESGQAIEIVKNPNSTVTVSLTKQ